MRTLRLSLLLFVPLLALAKSYYFPEVNTEVRLQADGNVRIVQERTYAFDGSFSWAYVDLLKQGAKDIVLNRLAEQRGDSWLDIEPTELTSSARSLYVRWSYSAENEGKVFLLDYTAVGAVRRYEDVADFYWKVIEDEHERVGRTAVSVVMPGPSSLLKVYVHSAAAPGRLEIADALGRAELTQSGIPENAFVEVRVLSSPGLYPGVAPTNERRYERILKEEKQNFASSTLRKHLLIPLALLLLIAVPLVLLLIFYLRFGREPKLDYEAIYEHEPPRKAPPLAVPFILHQKPDKSSMSQELFQGMMATLLDLARRGIVSVHEVKHGHKSKYEFRLDRPAADLEPFEKAATDSLFGMFAGGGTVLTEDIIKEYGKDHPMELKSMLGRLYSDGMSWWKQELGLDFTDAASRHAYALFGGLAAVCCIGGAILFAAGLRTIAPSSAKGQLPLIFVISLLGIVAWSLLGRSILRWDPSAYLEHRRWLNFRKFLRDFSAIEQAPVQLLAIWEHFYVYAVALGVAQEFLRNVTRLAEQRQTAMVLPVWYVAASGGHGAGMASLADSLAGFQSFGANLGSMMSSFSTASTSGGGFSGGGGGGGGGGSSGAG
jgi:uncharacterized membrane protein